MKISIALIFALTLPVTLLASFSANQLKSSSISRGPAIEQARPTLKQNVLKYLVANAK